MTVREEVQKRYDELLEARRQEYDTIGAKLAEARAQKTAAEQRIKEATAKTDIEAFGKAQADARKYQTAIEMYEGRQAQLAGQELITQQEGDETVDRLLKYEEDLDAKYEADVLKPLQQLKALHTAYANELRDTELLIQAWTHDVKSNYRSFTGSQYYDETTGKHTNISPRPIAVHAVPYTGGTVADIVGQFLAGRAKDLL